MSSSEPTGPKAVRLVLTTLYATVLACLVVGLTVGVIKHSVIWGIGGGIAFAAVGLLINSLAMAALKPRR